MGQLAIRCEDGFSDLDYGGGNDGDLAADRHNNSIEETYRTIVSAAIELAKADGAVIFNEDMELVGGGVFLKSANIADDLGGARHRSARGFAELVPQSVAICISQDGSVSFFHK